MKAAGPRIPLELQRIFLASNSGEVVNEAPPKGIGFRVFKRGFRLSSYTNRTRGTALGKDSQHSVSKSTRTNDTATACTSPGSSSHDLDAFETPQLLLEALLSKRGYSTVKYSAADTSFRFQPTPYELASFHNFTLKIVEEDKNDTNLRNVLEAGISPNACNRECELLLHKACRLGKHQHVRLFLEFGADPRVCSVSGRTALHDTCCSPRPSFQTFALLVAKDPSLVFMKDCRGLCPLQYIRKEHHVFWLEYLEVNVDKFWPMRSDEQPKISSSRLGKPFTRTLAKPSNALPPELAHMIATGKMTTKEVLMLLDDAPAVRTTNDVSVRGGADAVDDSSESSESDDDDSDDDEDSDDSDDSSSCLDEDLANELGWLLGLEPLER
jgi:hypothetical protein